MVDELLWTKIFDCLMNKLREMKWNKFVTSPQRNFTIS